MHGVVVSGFTHLAWLHVLGLQAFGACRHLKLYLLAFNELAIPFHLDGAVMHKDIFAAIIGRNEAVALGIVEPLHRSGRHVCCSSQKEIDDEAVVRRATAMKNPLLAVSLSGSCAAATSGYYVLRCEIYHAVPEPSNPACLTPATA